jgi:hypothetical protein
MSHICAADDCNNPFDPVLPEQIYCSRRCSTRMRVRRLRARRKNNPGPGGGGKRRQLALFSSQSVSAKRVKQPRPETAPLFTMFANGKHEKHFPIPVNSTLCLLSDIASDAAVDPQVALPKPVQPASVGGLDAAA